VLTVGQVATIPVPLNVGAQTQNVVVTAEAPAVESTNNTIQSGVEENVVSNLPLNGRNPAALMYTAAGITDATLDPKGTNPTAPSRAERCRMRALRPPMAFALEEHIFRSMERGMSIRSM